MIRFAEIRSGLDKLVFLLLARSAAPNYNCCTHSGGIYQSQRKVYWVKRLASLGGSLCLQSSVGCTKSVVPRFALAEFFVVLFVFEGGEELKKFSPVPLRVRGPDKIPCNPTFRYRCCNSGSELYVVTLPQFYIYPGGTFVHSLSRSNSKVSNPPGDPRWAIVAAAPGKNNIYQYRPCQGRPQYPYPRYSVRVLTGFCVCGF